MRTTGGTGSPSAHPEQPTPLLDPPDDLAQRALPIRSFVNPQWFRGHKAHRGPIYFNRTAGRFAALNGEFGTLYLGDDEFSSFLEAFSQELLNHNAFGPMISLNRLRRCCLCPVTATRTIHLVDLTNGPALLQLSTNADNRINDGPHVTSQRWARSFWEHSSKPDGLFYRSRRSPERHAIALFDHTESDLQGHCDQNLLTDPDRLASILDYFNCALIP